MSSRVPDKLADMFFSVLYSADEHRMRTLIRLLNKTLLLTAGAVVIISLLALWKNALTVSLINFFFYLFSLFYLRSGHIRFAGLGSVVMLLVSVTYVVYTGNGIHDVGIILYPIVLILGSLVFNLFYFTILVLLCVASVTTVGLLEYYGHINSIYAQDMDFADIIVTLVLVVFSAVFIRILTEYSISAFQRATKKEHQFSEILNSLYDAVIILDADDRRIVDVNKTMLNMFGYKREDISRFTLETLTAEDEEFNRDIAREHLKRSFTEGTTNFRWRAKKKDGSLFWVDVSLKLTQIDDVQRIVVIVRDIDLQLRMEEQLKQAEKLTAIGQLAGGIAHDFNNMLAGILGAAELLNVNRKKDEDSDMLDLIINTSQQAADLTGKLLSFSKKRHIVFDRVQVKEILNEVCSILQRSIDKRITVTVVSDECDASVLGDRTQLLNALLNLGINAKDAMAGEGRITYETAIVHLDDSYCSNSSFNVVPGDYVRLRVIDNGCGIKPSDKERIFQPFYTTKTDSQHTGLGLAAVYGVMLEHKGAIEVHSEPDKGTEFTIYLPTTDQQSDRVSRKSGLVEGSGCILVIDDEEAILKSVAAMLERLGYTVLVAENGRRGIEVFKSHHADIDLVLMDMQMPELDGPSCFKEIRSVDNKISVIISSGFSEDGATRSLLEDGAAAFIGKPYRFSALSQIIAENMPVG